MARLLGTVRRRVHTPNVFSLPCRVCSADVLDAYRHMAWHVAEGHDISEDRIAMLDEASKIATAEAQRRWKEARAT